MLRFAIAPPPTDLSIFVAMVIMRNYITIVVNILCTSTYKLYERTFYISYCYPHISYKNIDIIRLNNTQNLTV